MRFLQRLGHQLRQTLLARRVRRCPEDLRLRSALAAQLCRWAETTTGEAEGQGLEEAQFHLEVVLNNSEDGTKRC